MSFEWLNKEWEEKRAWEWENDVDNRGNEKRRGWKWEIHEKSL